MTEKKRTVLDQTLLVTTVTILLSGVASCLVGVVTLLRAAF